MNRFLAAALMIASLCGGAQAQDNAARCEPAKYRPAQFRVAIDRPSGIAFIHSPCGWTYLGVVAQESIDEGIRISQAKPVPARVLRAELARQPELARHLPAVAASKPVGSVR